MLRLLLGLCALGLGAGLSPCARGAPLPALPGDCNLDWSVDAADFADLEPCLEGPTQGPDGVCTCYDLDADGDVDVHDLVTFQAAFTGTQFLLYELEVDADDGTEVDQSVWYADGYNGTGRNRMGTAGRESYDVGLRFHLPEVRQGESFVYARLVLPAADDGQVGTGAQLRIVGGDQDSPLSFDLIRPSQIPKTDAIVEWQVETEWPDHDLDSDCTPLHRYSPDLAPIINEILSRPAWGTGPDGKALALIVEDAGSEDTNFLACHDYRWLGGCCPGVPIRARLELYRTVRSTFVAPELLGCCTDSAVTVNALSLLTLEVYFEVGTTPGVYDASTPPAIYPGGSPIEVVLGGLAPDTRHYYRMRYRCPGAAAFAAGPEHSFHTQRAAGSTFAFAVQADSHLQDFCCSTALYRTVLQNVLADEPDFLIDLGDTFHCESYVDRDVLDLAEAVERHLDQRPYLGLVCHSAPFFFVIGNHEGEQGWRLDGTPDNVAVWATTARKLIYPLPVSDGFYTGSMDEVEFVGLRENYYAWEWGNALFVVLDPFWYTTTCPHGWSGTPGSGDNWDWTLGPAQYEWFKTMLENSEATFKFVFCHHVTGGTTTYGRGGTEAASHALGARGSFEWGGEDLAGNDVFAEKRPGWAAPMHDVMAANGVTIFFHGHDHVFVKQELDGVVYQECPQPSDAAYRPGFYVDGLYRHGDRVNNSGHVRVTVCSAQVTVAYIRAYLPGDGSNGEVAYSYTITAGE